MKCSKYQQWVIYGVSRLELCIDGSWKGNKDMAYVTNLWCNRAILPVDRNALSLVGLFFILPFFLLDSTCLSSVGDFTVVLTIEQQMIVSRQLGVFFIFIHPVFFFFNRSIDCRENNCQFDALAAFTSHYTNIHTQVLKRKLSFEEKGSSQK